MLLVAVTGDGRCKVKGHYPEVSDEIRQLPAVSLPAGVDENDCFLILADKDDIVEILVMDCG